MYIFVLLRQDGTQSVETLLSTAVPIIMWQKTHSDVINKSVVYWANSIERLGQCKKIVPPDEDKSRANQNTDHYHEIA